MKNTNGKEVLGKSNINGLSEAGKACYADTLKR